MTRPVRLYRIALGDHHVLAHEHGADVVFFQVQRQPVTSWGSRAFPPPWRAPEAVDAGDTVPDFQDAADLLDVEASAS